jgi:hypothetical protein
MSTDVLHYVASICLIVITIFVSWAGYRAIKILNKVDYILLGVTELTDEVKNIKNGVKMSLASLISGLANIIKRR